MIIVKLKGGLGNQMFQYAFARSLSIKNKTSFKVDLHFLLDRTPRENFVFRNYDLDIFNLQIDTATDKDLKIFNTTPASLGNKIYTSVLKKVLSPEVIVQKNFSFNSSYLSSSKNLYLDGYWQSEKFFKENERVIRNDFTFKNILSAKENQLDATIKSTASVCVNFRRTDFVSLPNAAQTHGVTAMEYYHSAIKHLCEKVKNPHFFVFSDDMEWCMENFKPDYPTTYVGHEYKGEKFSSYLQLMKNCKHFIIPNSSFAWWAAWLSDNAEKVVIAPKQWFADKQRQPFTGDIIPSSWIQL